jgi:hypothetical protein
MLVYLASPIDTCGDHLELVAVRHNIIEWLREQGAVVYAPNRAWSLDPRRASADELDRLSQINFTALDESDLVVALAPPGVPTVGVPIEVYHALTFNAVSVALWFGVPLDRPVGALWAHLMAAFASRVYPLPTDPTLADIKTLYAWAQCLVERVHD